MQSAIPATMQAIQFDQAGGPEVLQLRDYPTPQPQAGEVLIRVAAAGVNRADTMQRQGRYPPPAGASSILGLEVAGEIVALGFGVTRWQLGDRVCALLAGGGYAQYVATAGGQCLPVPTGVSMTEAAALPEALVTVWANLFEAGGLVAGATALAHGGSSGIGTTAIQLVKLFGARVIVTVGSAEKAAACRLLGADHVVNYHEQDFVAAVKDIARQGVDVVLDTVGGDYLNRNLATLAPHGRHVSIATQQGPKAELDLRLVMMKQLTVTGSTLRGRDMQEKARLVAAVEARIWPFVTGKAFKPLISNAYPLKNAGEAHKMMESSAHIGKIVLDAAS